MMDEKEVRHRCNEVDATFQTKGWPYLEAEWLLERERIIEAGKKAVEEGKTETAAYRMAELAGFDRALKVPQTFKFKFESYLTEDKQKHREEEQVNA